MIKNIALVVDRTPQNWGKGWLIARGWDKLYCLKPATAQSCRSVQWWYEVWGWWCAMYLNWWWGTNYLRSVGGATSSHPTQGTENLVDHVEKFISKEKLPLFLKTTRDRDITWANLCRFSSGRDVTIFSRDGVVVNGGLALMRNKLPPWGRCTHHH